MAIQKPYSINISNGQAIPAEENFIIRWKVSGAIQTHYAIQIINNADNIVAFSIPKTASYNTFYELQLNSLINGNDYKILITVYDDKNNSATSDQIIFQTSSRPVIAITNLGLVANPSYNFVATYTQSENVGMRSYIAYLYNESQILLRQSNIKTILPMEHLFTDLQSETSYYVEFQATSNKGLVGTTGKLKFDVLYTRPQLAVNLTARNVENAGIKISWFVNQIIGHSDSEVTYIDNEKADLTLGNKVYFDENFSIDRNFQLGIWLSSPPISDWYNENTFLTLIGEGNNKFLFQYWSDNKFKLIKEVNGIRSTWTSESVIGANFFIRVKQVGDNCDIHAEVII